MVCMQLVSKGVVEQRDTMGKAAKNLTRVRRSQSCRGLIVSLEPDIESVQRRCNSVETAVLVMHDGWSDQVNFSPFDSRKNSRFPKM